MRRPSIIRLDIGNKDKKELAKCNVVKMIELRRDKQIDNQINFICGAGRSKGKKPNIAHPSVTTKGLSNISATLIERSGVVSTRAIMHGVITKQGAVNLYSKTVEEPAQLLISCAHTEHQESLDQAGCKRLSSYDRFIQSNKKKHEAGIFLPFYILKTVGNSVFGCSKMKNFEFNLN